MEGARGAAARRRERRLRCFWRHEQLSLKMALAAEGHHSTQPRAKEEVERELHHAPRRKKLPPQGTRPASLAEPRADVERVQRHIVDQMVDAPLLLGVLSPFDFRVAEQVIEVPKIVCPPRAARTVLCAPQLAEQLVEVPTPVSYSSSSQRSMEQIVDIPASVRGVSGSLQGFHPEQSTAQRTALQIADIPVPGRGDFGCPFGFLPEQGTSALHVSQERISERIVEQIDSGGDFPSRRAGPRFVLPRQGSTAAGAE